MNIIFLEFAETSIAKRLQSCSIATVLYNRFMINHTIILHCNMVNIASEGGMGINAVVWTPAIGCQVDIKLTE